MYVLEHIQSVPDIISSAYFVFVAINLKAFKF